MASWRDGISVMHIILESLELKQGGDCIVHYFCDNRKGICILKTQRLQDCHRRVSPRQNTSDSQ